MFTSQICQCTAVAHIFGTQKNIPSHQNPHKIRTHVCWSLILYLRASRCKVQNHRPEHTLLIGHIKGKKSLFQTSNTAAVV